MLPDAHAKVRGNDPAGSRSHLHEHRGCGTTDVTENSMQSRSIKEDVNYCTSLKSDKNYKTGKVDQFLYPIFKCNEYFSRKKNNDSQKIRLTLIFIYIFFLQQFLKYLYGKGGRNKNSKSSNTCQVVNCYDVLISSLFWEHTCIEP